MLKRFRIKRWVKIFTVLLLVFSLISFVEKKNEEKICKKIVININNEFENYFVDEQDIQYLIHGALPKNPIGQKLSDINLKHLEEKIETNKFVKDAQVFKDLKGNLMVTIDQMRPLARVVYPWGSGAYLSTDGTVLPLSSKFSSRVIVVSGPFVKKITTSFLEKEKEGKALVAMIKHIQEDEFLNAQIAQLDINSIGEIVLYPQVGQQYIEFGKAEDITKKFIKLKTFYKKILPVHGWGAYQKVSLKYEKQIVCE